MRVLPNSRSLDPSAEMQRLFHPRRERWSDHFRLIQGLIVAITPIGRATLRLLQFNRPERVQERELIIQAGLFSEGPPQ